MRRYIYIELPIIIVLAGALGVAFALAF